jgi:hypothetical protein
MPLIDGWYWAVRWIPLDPFDQTDPKFDGQYPRIVFVSKRADGLKVLDGIPPDESIRAWRLLKPIPYWGERTKNEDMVPP